MIKEQKEQINQQKEEIVSDKQTILKNILQRYSKIHIQEMAELLDFNDTIQIKRWLLSLPQDFTFYLEDDEVIIDNQKFRPVSDGVIEYELLIYNRWGELIFKTKDLDEGWDGPPPMRRDFDTKEYSNNTFFQREGRVNFDPREYMREKLYPTFPKAESDKLLGNGGEK